MRDALVGRHAFDEVYWPVEPRNAPALRLEITARGTVEEDSVRSVLKSVVIGALLFLPVGVIQLHKTFHLDALAVYMNAREREQGIGKRVAWAGGQV